MSGNYRLKINDDGTCTASFGDTTTTFDTQPGEDGRVQVQASFENHRGSSHNATVTDGGQKTTLTCSCGEFTAMCETGTAEERAASVEHAYQSHADKVDRARAEVQFRDLFNPKENQ
jgi:hypothetical protein